MIGLIVGEICEAHKKIVWEKNNFVWIDPTRNMSPHQVNEFKNRLNMFIADSYTEPDSELLLLIWTNESSLINLGLFTVYWRVEDGKLYSIKIKAS